RAPPPPDRGARARAASPRAPGAPASRPRASRAPPPRAGAVERPAAPHELAEAVLSRRRLRDAVDGAAPRGRLRHEPAREPPPAPPRQAAPSRIGVEHAGAVGEREARNDEAAELHEIPPRADGDEEPAPPRAVVVEEEQAIAGGGDRQGPRVRRGSPRAVDHPRDRGDVELEGRPGDAAPAVAFPAGVRRHRPPPFAPNAAAAAARTGSGGICRMQTRSI